MNANELADELKEISLIADNHTKIVLDIAATMLRQQQAEIEALKRQVEVLSKAFETACDGLETSLDLNKAQSERYWSKQP
jgi:nicotinate-nucleotide pyrophosphorylase